MMMQELWQDLKAFGGVPVFVVIVLAALVFNKTSLAAQVVLGFAVSFALTFAIRAFYFRRRPDREEYRSFFQRIDASSFPSLHAMRAAVLWVLMMFAFPQPYLIALFALIIVFVAVARVYLNRHYPSDVIAGVVIGAIIAYACTKIVPLLGF